MKYIFITTYGWDGLIENSKDHKRGDQRNVHEGKGDLVESRETMVDYYCFRND